MPDEPTDAARPLRVAFVPGVTLDKWLRIWQERSPDPIDVTPVDAVDQIAVLHGDTADMSFVRLPVDREALHVIPLYFEVPVAVLPKGHVLTALDRVTTTDLADESAVDLATMSVKHAIEVVASGAGYVIVPMSVARLHHRKDVETRPMSDMPQTQIALSWLAENADPRIEQFIGVVRGRTERSSRAEPTPPQASRPRKATPAKKSSPRRDQGRRRRR